MSKIKVMLTVVIVLATVGGALAIKVKRTQVICTAPLKADGTCGDDTPGNSHQLCTGSISNVRVTFVGAHRCTAVPNSSGTPCPTTKKCSVDDFITAD